MRTKCGPEWLQKRILGELETDQVGTNEYSSTQKRDGIFFI